MSDVPQDAAPSSTEPVQAVPAVDVPNDALVAAAPTAEPASVSNADGASTTLPSGASSAEPVTLEQRVADLERALVSLPHSIATVMHRGSMEPVEFAKAVVAHLFGHEE